MIEQVLIGSVAGGTCIVFAGLGEIVAERSGVINLGTEGSMLCGALAAYAVGIETGSPWLGVLAGIAAGAALAAVHAALVLHRNANQIAVGIWMPTPAQAGPWIAQGVQLITVASNDMIFFKGCQEYAGQVKALIAGQG